MNWKNLLYTLPVLVGWAVLWDPAGLHAQVFGDGDLESGQNHHLSVTASTLYQPSSHVAGGGDLTVARYSITTGSTILRGNRLSLTVGLSYDLDDYNFSKLSGFAVPDPWNKINEINLNTSVAYRLSREWSLVATPVVGYAGEEGADFGDSLVYGGAVMALYRPTPSLMVGFGGGVFSRLDETSWFPAFLFSWKITDKLRLGNAFGTGPTGPAGLELAYAIDSNWETALGGGYRTKRFRLSDKGPASNGIGEVDSWPAYARLSRKIGRNLRLDLYGGAAFGGKLRLDDSRGHRIDRASYDTAPLVGLSLTTRF